MDEEKGLTRFDAEFSRAQVDLIKRVCAKGATDDEFRVFLHFCQSSGLDPLRKQAHFIVREWTDKNGNPRRETTMMAGIDGLRARAEKMKDFDGLSSAAVYTGDEIDINFGTGVVSHKAKFPRKKPILGAWAKLNRKGRTPAVVWVDIDEYKDDRSPMWQDKQAVMICKTAEGTILRHEYPEPMSGIYVPEEFGKSTNDSGEIVTEVEVVETESGEKVNTATGEVVEPEAIGRERAIGFMAWAEGLGIARPHVINAARKYHQVDDLAKLTEGQARELMNHLKAGVKKPEPGPVDNSGPDGHPSDDSPASDQPATPDYSQVQPQAESDNRAEVAAASWETQRDLGEDPAETFGTLIPHSLLADERSALEKTFKMARSADMKWRMAGAAAAKLNSLIYDEEVRKIREAP